MVRCPSCGASNLPNTLFCEECGDRLLEPAQSGEPGTVSKPAKRETNGASETPILRLIVKDSGHVFRVPYGEEALIGRKDAQSNFLPSVDLTDQGGVEHGVSRRHARISFRDGQPYLEDTGSTNGTWLGRRQLEPFLPCLVESGAEISLGNMVLLIDFA